MTAGTEPGLQEASTLAGPLLLPCGAILKNRVAKAAMTEGLADSMNRATPAHNRIYRRWANGGFGLMLTGNIQIDRRHLERPGNIAIDDNDGLDALKSLAAIGTRDGAHFWVQLNHPGRQAPAAINARPLAPSSISLPMGEAGCGEAQAMTQAQIADAIRRFADAASVCREMGFTGIQIHAAHGYLLSQFLSPLANARTDEWGGTVENRARMLIETIRATRARIGADFPISVKLNSADFQRGGFSEEDSVEVVRLLDREGIDLLEISGGNYEQMQMVGLGEEAPPRAPAESTLLREAYFIGYARKIKPICSIPVMMTGGMRSHAAMQAVLAAGVCDIIGIARPLCTHPDLTFDELVAAPGNTLPALERGLRMAPDALGPDIDAGKFKKLESFGLLGWYCLQIIRLGEGQEADHAMNVFDALIGYKANEERSTASWLRPAPDRREQSYAHMSHKIKSGAS